MKNNRYERIDHLIAIAASEYLQREVARFESLDTSNVQFDATYYRKRAKIIRQIKRRPMLQKVKLIAVRVAVALLILILLAALVISCVPPVREAVFKAFIAWQDDHFKVSFQVDNGIDSGLTSPAQTDEEKELSTDTGSDSSDTMSSDPPSTEVLNPPTKIEVKRKPTALPQGTYEDVVWNSPIMLSIDYYLNDGFLFSYSQNLLTAQQGYDNTNAIITNVLVNGRDGVFVEYNQDSPNYLEWSDGEYRYQIMSEVYGKDELIAIAESVK